MGKVYDLREILAQEAAFEGQTVTVQGWVRNHRKQKNIGFIEFFDGTALNAMQVVYDEKVADFAAVQAIRNGAAVRATGVPPCPGQVAREKVCTKTTYCLKVS